MAQAHRRFRSDSSYALSTSGPSVTRSLSVLQDIYGDDFARAFSVRLWDGTYVRAVQDERYIFHVNAPHALRAAFTPPVDLNPGRSFAHRLIDIEGELEFAVAELERAVQRIPKWHLPLLAAKLALLPAPPALNDDGAALRGQAHSLRRDREAIGFHYDLPAAFYRSFLDRNLVYSCAYFRNPVDSLDDAQISKLDHILRKLRVAPGEELLDIGCGFGALVIRAAGEFGAHATGITLSHTQYDEARRRVAAEGLEGRITIALRDYRELERARFDKIASVGMVEHVGRENLAVYFSTLFGLLRPGGLLLNHGIADQSPDRRGWRSSGFIGRYVFPDGDLIPLAQMLSFAERAGFEVRDVESLREHYAKTLRAWRERLERNTAAVIAETSEFTYRVYNLYLAGSAHGFASGRMNLFQSLLAKPGDAGRVDLPPTRAELYS